MKKTNKQKNKQTKGWAKLKSVKVPRPEALNRV